MQLMANHRDHVTGDLVEVDGLGAQRLALDQRADAVDDGARTGARLHDPLECPLRPFQVRRLGGEPARAGRGAADHAEQRLVDLVRDRRGHFSERRHARHMSERRLCLSQGVLRSLSFRHVPHGAEHLHDVSGSVRAQGGRSPAHV